MVEPNLSEWVCLSESMTVHKYENASEAPTKPQLLTLPSSFGCSHQNHVMPALILHSRYAGNDDGPEPFLLCTFEGSWLTPDTEELKMGMLLATFEDPSCWLLLASCQSHFDSK